MRQKDFDGASGEGGEVISMINGEGGREVFEAKKKNLKQIKENGELDFWCGENCCGGKMLPSLLFG